MRERSRSRNAIGDFADPALIDTLAGWLEQSGAREIEITTADGQALKIVLGAAGKAGAAAAPRGEDVRVKAPLAGHFRLAGDSQAGRTVEAGEILAFVEVGPVRLPVVAPAAGRLGDIHAGDGDAVGYGAILFTVESAA